MTKQEKKQSLPSVVIFGSFDIIHPGHIFLIKQAAALGAVTVVVARDKTIEKVKSKKPFFSEKQRVKHLQMYPEIKRVTLGNVDNPYKILATINPHIILLGHDQKIFINQLPDELKKINLQPTILRAKPWQAEFFKSSKIRPALQNKQAGFLLINKPSDITSHDVVNNVRKIAHTKKVGHAGTLDPLATGLLIIGINEATKLLSWWHYFPKTYVAEMEFGKISDTYDLEGIIKIIPTKKIPLQDIRLALTNFTGDIKQRPPIFSAKKIKGQKAYDLARKKINLKLAEQTINISAIQIIEYSWPRLKLSITCSTGTYIRSLIDDLGKKLNTGAIMTNLNRTAIGSFDLKNAVSLSSLQENFYDKNYFISTNDFLKKIIQSFSKNNINKLVR